MKVKDIVNNEELDLNRDELIQKMKDALMLAKKVVH